MSMEAAYWAMQQRAGGAGEKLVLILLTDWVDQIGHAMPCLEKIADTAEESVEWVTDRLDDLSMRGLIEVAPRKPNDLSPSPILIKLKLPADLIYEYDAPSQRTPKHPLGKAKAAKLEALAGIVPEHLAHLANLKAISPLVESGVYILCMEKRVVYVGQSIFVAERVLEHQATKTFDQAFMIPCGVSELSSYERWLIGWFKPKLNLTRGSGGGPVSIDQMLDVGLTGGLLS